MENNTIPEIEAPAGSTPVEVTFKTTHVLDFEAAQAHFIPADGSNPTPITGESAPQGNGTVILRHPDGTYRLLTTRNVEDYGEPSTLLNNMATQLPPLNAGTSETLGIGVNETETGIEIEHRAQREIKVSEGPLVTESTKTGRERINKAGRDLSQQIYEEAIAALQTIHGTAEPTTDVLRRATNQIVDQVAANERFQDPQRQGNSEIRRIRASLEARINLIEREQAQQRILGNDTCRQLAQTLDEEWQGNVPLQLRGKKLLSNAALAATIQVAELAVRETGDQVKAMRVVESLEARARENPNEIAEDISRTMERSAMYSRDRLAEAGQPLSDVSSESARYYHAVRSTLRVLEAELQLSEDDFERLDSELNIAAAQESRDDDGEVITSGGNFMQRASHAVAEIRDRSARLGPTVQRLFERTAISEAYRFGFSANLAIERLDTKSCLTECVLAARNEAISERDIEQVTADNLTDERAQQKERSRVVSALLAGTDPTEESPQTTESETRRSEVRRSVRNFIRRTTQAIIATGLALSVYLSGRVGNINIPRFMTEALHGTPPIEWIQQKIETFNLSIPNARPAEQTPAELPEETREGTPVTIDSTATVEQQETATVTEYAPEIPEHPTFYSPDIDPAIQDVIWESIQSSRADVLAHIQDDETKRSLIEDTYANIAKSTGTEITNPGIVKIILSGNGVLVPKKIGDVTYLILSLPDDSEWAGTFPTAKDVAETQLEIIQMPDGTQRISETQINGTCLSFGFAQATNKVLGGQRIFIYPYYLATLPGFSREKFNSLIEENTPLIEETYLGSSSTINKIAIGSAVNLFIQTEEGSAQLNEFLESIGLRRDRVRLPNTKFDPYFNKNPMIDLDAPHVILPAGEFDEFKNLLTPPRASPCNQRSWRYICSN